jgi:hypothetical protein
MCLYVSALGQSEGTQCEHFDGPRIADVQPLRMGDGDYFTARPFDGWLDDVAVWNVALNPDQIQLTDALGAAHQPLFATLGD